MRDAARKVVAQSNRSTGVVLCAWAVVVLEAVAPGYAWSWGGLGDGRGGKKARERSRDGHVVVSELQHCRGSIAPSQARDRRWPPS